MPESHSPPTRRSRSTRQPAQSVSGQRSHAQRAPATPYAAAGQHRTAHQSVPRWLIVLVALAAALAAVAMLLVEPLRSLGTPVFRVLLLLTWVIAATIIFVPLQRRLEAPGLAWQSVVGWALLGYILAFVPAPSGSLLDLPELPSYLLLFFAVFYAAATATTPVTWLVARRRLADPYLQAQRARRQAYELAALVVATMAMAALRVLTLWAFGLLVLVTILAEALLVLLLDGTLNRE